MDYQSAVNKALHGDEEGFVFLYQNTYKSMYRIAYSYLRSECDTEDVLQESYIKAKRHLNTLTNADSFPSWLSRIVINTAKSYLKKRDLIKFSDIIINNDDEEEEFDIPDENDVFQPEIAYSEKEINDLLKKLIESLSDEQRLCILMYYYDELSVREIAKIFCCSENTIKSRLSYGRKALKKKAENMEKEGYSFHSASTIPVLKYLIDRQSASSDFTGAAEKAMQRSASSILSSCETYASKVSLSPIVKKMAGKKLISFCVAVGIMGGGAVSAWAVGGFKGFAKLNELKENIMDSFETAKIDLNNETVESDTSFVNSDTDSETDIENSDNEKSGNSNNSKAKFTENIGLKETSKVEKNEKKESSRSSNSKDTSSSDTDSSTNSSSLNKNASSGSNSSAMSENYDTANDSVDDVSAQPAYDNSSVGSRPGNTSSAANNSSKTAVSSQKNNSSKESDNTDNSDTNTDSEFEFFRPTDNQLIADQYRSVLQSLNGNYGYYLCDLNKDNILELVLVHYYYELGISDLITDSFKFKDGRTVSQESQLYDIYTSYVEITAYTCEKEGEIFQAVKLRDGLRRSSTPIADYSNASDEEIYRATGLHKDEYVFDPWCFTSKLAYSLYDESFEVYITEKDSLDYEFELYQMQIKDDRLLVSYISQLEEDDYDLSDYLLYEFKDINDYTILDFRNYQINYM